MVLAQRECSRNEAIVRAGIYLVPCALVALEEQQLAVGSSMYILYVLVLPLLYSRLLACAFLHVDDIQNILREVLVAGIFVLERYEARLLDERIDHPVVTTLTVVVSDDEHMAAVGIVLVALFKFKPRKVFGKLRGRYAETSGVNGSVSFQAQLLSHDGIVEERLMLALCRTNQIVVVAL